MADLEYSLGLDVSPLQRAGAAARRLAEQHFARGKLSAQFVGVLEGVARELS